ncbi:MAG: methyltransferase domain-containing protein [Granulosicoccus sp.]|nr:methyltransferase domain-containing protein [Granulosicoccus sp.]
MSTQPKIDKFDRRLSRLYSGCEDKEALYDGWAENYEKDLVDDLAYVAHIDAAKIFASQVEDLSSHIIDVACGTGLVAKELRGMGYANIDGVDFSNEMLGASRATGCYQTVFQHDFTAPPERTGIYDALICVGLFAFDVPGIEHMVNVIDLVRPGCLCIITVNGAAWIELGLESAVKQQSQQHQFFIENILGAGYIENQNIDAKVLVIRRGHI